MESTSNIIKTDVNNISNKKLLIIVPIYNFFHSFYFEFFYI